MSKTAKAVLLLLAALLLAGGGVAVGLGRQPAAAPPAAALDPGTEDYTGDRATYQGEKNTDTIDIPGYEAITLQAGTAQQSVNLYNPEQNSCYFKISLLLADGTVLWQSDLVAPGKAIYELTLAEPLPAGEYADAVLKYECFAMDEAQTPLNGSEIKLTLNALE